MTRLPRALIALVIATFGAVSLAAQDDKSGFTFRSGVELINVTATVTDGDSRLLPGSRPRPRWSSCRCATRARVNR